jgi:uncharacterized protein (TIGR02118 family)
MKIAVFVTIWAAQVTPADLRSYFLDQPLAFLEGVPTVVSVDLFVPDPGDVALFDGPAAPALMIQIDFENAADAEALIQSDDFRNLVLAEAAYPAPIEKLALDVFETVHFPIPGHKTPPPRTAPLSFVVRYYGPTEDVAAFDSFYTENHPPILATFPGIRNVLCYLPLGWRTTGKVSDASMILGNEVVFDDIDALNRALESDVMTPLREDGQRFAEFGFNTHHAMQRERIYTNGDQ